MALIKAWHFSNENCHYTGRHFRPVGDPEVLLNSRPLKPHQNGLHSAEHVYDAFVWIAHLEYGRYLYLHRVQIGGEIETEEGIHVSRERTILWTINGYHAIREYQKWCGFTVSGFWDCPYVVGDYLLGEPRATRRDAEDYFIFDDPGERMPMRAAYHATQTSCQDAYLASLCARSCRMFEAKKQGVYLPRHVVLHQHKRKFDEICMSADLILGERD